MIRRRLARGAVRFPSGPALVLAVSSLGLACAGIGQYPFDLPYVERDVCPFECCTYGTWTARAPLYLTDEPDPQAQVRRQIEAGETFTARGGDVHVRAPGTAVVREGRNQFEDGEHLWVFAYRGEGTWDVWVAGDLVTLPLLSGPDEQGDPGQPAIVLEKPPRTQWWVEVETPNGERGWILMDPDDLRVEGADACE